MNHFGLVLWLLGIIAALAVPSYFLARLSIHPPRFAERKTPADLGLEGEKIEFDSLDGLKIRGWWIPSAADSAAAHGATVVLCHGHAMSHTMMLKYAPFLHAAGFHVLLFDFRGRGASEGDATSVGFHEVADLMGAVRFVRQRTRGRVGVFGVSMGGAVAIRAAAVCESIHAVATECAYARLSWALLTYCNLLAPVIGCALFPFLFHFGQRFAGIRIKLAAPVEFIARISPRPVLIIHGHWDLMVWRFHGRLLHAAAGEPKQLWLVPRAWHAASYRTAPAEFEARLTRFFAAALLGNK